MDTDTHIIPNWAFLLALIRTILLLHKGLTWSSNHRYPIQAIRLAWLKTWRWECEPNGMAKQRLNAQLEVNDSLGMRELHNAFTKRNPVSYVRDTDKESVNDLYILVRFGWYAVGFRTQIMTD